LGDTTGGTHAMAGLEASDLVIFWAENGKRKIQLDYSP
jgi:hypothetical protein